jgi:hypothetical protein
VPGKKSVRFSFPITQDLLNRCVRTVKEEATVLLIFDPRDLRIQLPIFVPVPGTPLLLPLYQGFTLPDFARGIPDLSPDFDPHTERKWRLWRPLHHLTDECG